MTSSQFHNPSKRAFSLPEVMVSVLIMGIVLAAMTSSFLFLVKSSTSLTHYSDMNRESRRFTEYFGRDSRMTTSISSATSSGFTGVVTSDAGKQTVTYEFDATTGEITRTIDASSIILLRNVQSASFVYYNILGAETITPVEIKEVQFQARMMRKVMHIENKNHVISARFMMRNKKVST